MFIDRLIATRMRGLLPDAWEVVLLDQVAERGSGHTPTRKKAAYWNGDVKWVSLKDTAKLDLTYITDTAERISNAGLANSSAVLRPAGTVILCRGAGVGKGAILAHAMAVSQDYVTWQCGPVLDNHFLYQWLQFMKPELQRVAVGSTIQAIGLPYFTKLRILLPPLAEQQAIAALLGTWDRAIDQTNQLIAAKRQMQRALCQALLEQPTQSGKVWPVRPLGDLFRPVSRKNAAGLDLVLTASGNDGLVDQQEYFGRRVAADDVTGYYLLQRGEFAYNRSAVERYPYGAIKRLDRYDAGVVSTLYICFATDDPTVCSDFYRHFFDADLLAPALRRVTQVGARAHGLLNVSKADFYRLGVPHPPLAAQQRIAAALNSAAAELDQLTALLATRQAQKRALAEQLLTGQLRLPLPEEV